MKRATTLLFALLVVSLIALVPHSSVLAAATRGMTLNIFSPMVDEQTGVGCTNPPAVAGAGLAGDLTSDLAAIGPSSAYNTAPWTQYATLGVAYANGGDCNPASGGCLGVNLNHNYTVLSVDTRGTKDPTKGTARTLRLDFSQPCAECAYSGGPTNLFGANPLATPGLLSVFLVSPYTSMSVCSSRACP